MKYLIIHRAFTTPPQLGYCDRVPEPWLAQSGDTTEILEHIFALHNADQRPDRFMRPSLSSNRFAYLEPGDDSERGDIVILFDEVGDRGYSCWECRSQGWRLFPTTDWPTELYDAFIRTIEVVQGEC